MGSAVIPLEWFAETINKRLGPPYSLKLSELFLIIPHLDEAEFDFEIPQIFVSQSRLNTFKHAAQGNLLIEDYPHLAKLIINSNKKVSIKTFFVHPFRLRACLLLSTRKYTYPKISLPNSIRPVLAFQDVEINQALKEHKAKERTLAAQIKAYGGRN